MSLTKYLKSKARRLAKRFGIEVHGYIPGASRDAQFLALLNSFKIDLIVDVGANQGQFGAEVYGSGYNGEMLSIEPMPDAHARLLKNSERNPKWKIYPATAIGAYNGFIDFHVSENSVSSSAMKVLVASTEAEVKTRQITTISVPISTLDEVLISDRDLGKKNSLLKIDTQGFEWEVLDGAKQSLNRFSVVLMELSLCPLYESQKLWLELIQRMNGLGYSVFAIFPEFTDPSNGRTLQINAAFHRH